MNTIQPAVSSTLQEGPSVMGAIKVCNDSLCTVSLFFIAHYAASRGCRYLEELWTNFIGNEPRIAICGVKLQNKSLRLLAIFACSLPCYGSAYIVANIIAKPLEIYFLSPDGLLALIIGTVALRLFLFEQNRKASLQPSEANRTIAKIFLETLFAIN